MTVALEAKEIVTCASVLAVLRLLVLNGAVRPRRSSVEPSCISHPRKQSVFGRSEPYTLTAPAKDEWADGVGVLTSQSPKRTSEQFELALNCPFTTTREFVK